MNENFWHYNKRLLRRYGTSLTTMTNVGHCFVCRTAKSERVQRLYALPAAHLPGVWIIPVSVLRLLQRGSAWSDDVTQLDASCAVFRVGRVAS